MTASKILSGPKFKFEGDKKAASRKIEKLEKELKKLQKERDFKSIESRFDEEHNLWEVHFVNKHGAEHVISWQLSSSAECRQLIAKFKQIEPYMEPPFVVETLAKAAPAARQNVAAYGVFRGTHTGEGGPVPPTGKKVEADYVYVMDFDGDRIRHLTKIWNDGISLTQLGWA